MEEIARVYAERAVQRRARRRASSTRSASSSASSPTRSPRTAICRCSSSAPTSPRPRSATASRRAVSGAEPELVNFLELLAEKHRMPVIFRIRRRFDELWAEENKQLEVRLTSAVELDPEVVERVRRRDRAPDRPQDRAGVERRREHHRRPRAASRQHGGGREPARQARETEKGSRPGGIVRGFSPKAACKAAAGGRKRFQGATDKRGNQAGRDRQDPARADRGPGHRGRRARGGRDGPLRGRRDRPRARP